MSIAREVAQALADGICWYWRQGLLAGLVAALGYLL